MQLQPLRPQARAGQLGSSLRPIAQLHAKRQFAKACVAAGKLWTARMEEASKVFYAPERKTERADGVERFLARHVYGEDATLTIVAESFVAVPALRQLAADSCARASTPKPALMVLASAASQRGDMPARLAFAVLLAADAGEWQAALPVLDGERSAVRAVLLAALADRSKPPQAWLQTLDGRSLVGDEPAALQLVRDALRDAKWLP